MADNVGYTPGTGANIKTDQGGSSGAHMQVVKLAFSADGDETFVTADADGLEVQIGKSVDLTVKPKAAEVFPVSDNGGNLSVDDGGASLTVDAPAAAPVAVRISNGGSFVDAFPVTDNGGSLTVDGAVAVSGTVTGNQGTASSSANGWPVKVTDGVDTVGISTIGSAKALKSDVIQSVLQQADKSTFTEGTSKQVPVGGVYNDTISADPTEDQAAALRITAKRGVHVNLRNSSGIELGTAADPVEVTIRSSGGTELGTAADPVEVGLRNSGGTELSTQSAPLLVARTHGDQTRVTKSIAIAASQTGATVWTPGAGKKFVIEDAVIALSVGGDLTVFDGTDAEANRLTDGTMPVTYTHLPLSRPFKSSTADNVLKYTSGTGITGKITLHGYEV